MEHVSGSISAQSLTYSYAQSSHFALERCSFDIAPGEFCLVAGGSGSGKSTFLRAVCGIVPHALGGVFSGSLMVSGCDIRATEPSQLAHVVGFVDQDPETQVVMNTVRSELAFPLQRRGYSPLVIARELEEITAIMGLKALLDRSTATLSGGELQRVALAAALVVRPEILVLDEPTAQLDPIAADDLIWRLRSLHEEFGMTILLAEHRLERCLAAADRVFTFGSGRLAHSGTPVQFLDWARDAAQELLPPAAKLAAALNVQTLPLTVHEAKKLLCTDTVKNSSDLQPGQEAETVRNSQTAQAASQSMKARRFWQKEAVVQDENDVAIVCTDLWYEPKQTPPILRGVNLTIRKKEIVVVMGCNGAGKSTLLKHFAGLLTPTRGRISINGRASLLLQNPNDYFLQDRVGAEASAQALDMWRLADFAESHPRDLSGGQRQRLALAIIAGDERPALLCLDEPTRGFDAQAKAELAGWIVGLKKQGSAVVVATHDTEFAAEFADRVLLVADGCVVADGDPHAVLGTGRYFTTDTARILAGKALTPQQGAAVVQARFVADRLRVAV